ncbi:MAG: glycoside hydrolase family 2, partial [Clostridia bacterium]|nr:glycoside hydrolase family 2 [Clostridia bacterium]
MTLKTKYEIGEIPHMEHPCPQSMRKNWLCLNGEWDFYKENTQGEKSYEGKIIVPFSPETLNSGIEEGFTLNSGEKIVYKRVVNVGQNLLLGRTLLHFGAVDSECTVYCNGALVGRHVGGFTAFAFDVSEALKEGDNELVVICTDEGTRNHGARGKQSDTRGGIWYTPQSGIWQTVWLESMPKANIGIFRITPDAKAKTVAITLENGGEAEIVVFDGGNEILREKFKGVVTLAYDFELWSHENPKLYDFVLTNEAGDEVRSYF